MSKLDPEDSNRTFLSTRFALVFGFGGLLAILALTGIDALRVLQQIRKTDSQIRSQFLYRNHLLNTLQSELYRSGTFVRDYLLDPEPARAETNRTNLEKVRRDMESSLESYNGQLEREEVREYSLLRSELSHYWEIIDPILQWSPDERHRKGYSFLREEIFPRRELMLELAGKIANINEQQLIAGNKRFESLLLELQSRLTLTLLATLVLGLAMAAFSSWKILKLEARANTQYLEVSEARSQLKDLSARLVQTQEVERRSLSRELHDEVGQALSAVLVELRILSAALATRSEEQWRIHVEMIKGLVENTVRVVRNMSLLLRPSMLDDLGLLPALRWQAREVSKRTSMVVTVTAELVSDDLPEDYKTCLYRVVQEALHNCSRHSHAKTVRIRIQQETDRVSLSIQDDGQGFEVNQSKGLGLLGIEERVTRLGGKSEIHSEVGGGTILAIELPLQPSEEIRSTRESETNSHFISR
ncbi:MAG: MCP four helix bundle domain-containing protein [Terriglobia bacterium]